MRIILTGCNGKMGRATAELLVARGDDVIGIDAAPLGGRPHKVVVDSLLNPYTIHRAFDEAGGPVDAVIHLANHTNSRVAPAEVVLRENLAMNTSVFMAAWGARVPRIVFASSVQAMLPYVEMDGFFGDRVPHALPISEAVEARPSNVYGLSKLLAERMLTQLANPVDFRGGITTAVSLRLPYILGPKEFDLTAGRTGPAELQWGGAEAFGYVHVDDAAEAAFAATRAATEGHEVCWTAAPDPRPAESVASIVNRFYKGVPGATEAVARGSLHDCSKAHRLLGWSATRTLAVERASRGIPVAN